MKNNKGYSLVEVMIVVAIIAIMGTFIFIGLGLLTGQNARECASNISTALSKEKNYSLTRSATIDCYMELVLDDDGYYVRYYQPKNAVVTGSSPDDDWVLAEEEKVGKKTVDVLCNFKDEGSVPISDGNDGNDARSVKFVYDRINGAFKLFDISDVSDGTTSGYNDASTAVCTDITINSRRKYEITLYSETGKHVVTRTN